MSGGAALNSSYIIILILFVVAVWLPMINLRRRIRRTLKKRRKTGGKLMNENVKENVKETPKNNKDNRKVNDSYFEAVTKGLNK